MQTQPIRHFLRQHLKIGSRLHLLICGTIRNPDANTHRAHQQAMQGGESLGAGGHLLGWPTLVFLFGLFFTIALFIRNVNGAILWGVLASTALSLILEAVVPSGSVKESATGWSLNVPSLADMKFTTPNFSLIGSADLFGAFTHIGPLAASLLVFTILLSVFFDAMGVRWSCRRGWHHEGRQG